MERKADENNTSIFSLQDEVISLILQNVGIYDILRFSTTCKWFNSMVNRDQSLWKKKLKHVVPARIFKFIEEGCHGDWLNEIKKMHILKKQIYSELKSMSHEHYGHFIDLTMKDVQNCLLLALSNKSHYVLTIHILEEIIKKTKINLEKYKIKEPFTLTGMYYANIVLSRLRHSFLAVKWIECTRNVKQPPPEFVLNFFLQWTDTTITYSNETVENKIQEWVKHVESLLSTHNSSNSGTIQERLAKGLLTERQVLAAVSEVIYRLKRMTVTTTANLDLLNMSKIFKTQCGSTIAVAVIYQAIARHCGVHCNIIAFPNHFFLEWTDQRSSSNSLTYKIDLNNGQLQIKSQCPFARTAQRRSNVYSPDFLLEYINARFHETMGAIKNWNIVNADYLRLFLNMVQHDTNPYKHFLGFLLTNQTHLAEPHLPYNINDFSESHMDIVLAMSNCEKTLEARGKHIMVKYRESHVKYAIGMICYHKIYDYVCVIQDWELKCPVECAMQQKLYNLSLGIYQPIYLVVAADQSKRYVVQQNLTEFSKPTRLYHLEEALGDGFSHFDGFAYVPNSVKKKEYPGDIYVTRTYRNRLASA